MAFYIIFWLHCASVIIHQNILKHTFCSCFIDCEIIYAIVSRTPTTSSVGEVTSCSINRDSSPEARMATSEAAVGGRSAEAVVVHSVSFF